MRDFLRSLWIELTPNWMLSKKRDREPESKKATSSGPARRSGTVRKAPVGGATRPHG